MSLKIYEHLEQRSPEWYAARCGMVTASAVGVLVATAARDVTEYPCAECGAEAGAPCISAARKTPTPIKTPHGPRMEARANDDRPPRLVSASGDTVDRLTYQLVGERITQRVEETPMSSAMWRGVIDEPRAVEVYAEHYAPVEPCGFMRRDEDGWTLGYSPDGLVGDDGLIEIKSRNQGRQVRTMLADEVPAENMAQIQAGLLASGREWCDYISYAGGMHLYRKRVLPDPRWFAAIETACRDFEQRAADLVDRYLKAAEGRPMAEYIPEFEEIVI